MLDSEIKDFKIKKGKLKICEKILSKIVTIFGQRKIFFIFKEETENNPHIIFSQLKKKLESTSYNENIKALYKSEDLKNKLVINIFFNIDEDNFQDFEKILKKDLRWIVFAVSIFLLD
jgi:hypothetical protein